MQDALPVEVEMDEPLAARVRAYLEGTLGWQVIDANTGEMVPPVCRLAGLNAAAVQGGPPVVMLVTDADDPGTAAEAAARLGPAAVLRWPEDRERLPEVVGRSVSSTPRERVVTGQLRIAASAGGVGATTVALSIGGLLGWAGHRALVIARGFVPVPGTRRLRPEDLAGSGTWRAATVVPGCPRLRVVACSDGVGDAVVDHGPQQVVVIRDLGSVEDADVLVLRRDRPGIEALAVSSAGTAVVLDEGVVPLRRIGETAGHRRVVVLPSSVRVARAAAHLRVPAGLPGAWLRSLRPVAIDLFPHAPAPSQVAAAG